MNKSLLPRARTLVSALLLQLAALCFRAHAAPGDVDLSFDPGSGVNGTVHAVVVQPDGKVIIGGEFTTVKGLMRTNLARLNADGSGDSTFAQVTFQTDPEIGLGPVHRLALQPDGRVFVGGTFDFGFTRLNSDGSADTAFNANAYAALIAFGYSGSSSVAVNVLPDGKVHLGPIRVNADGTRDNSFNAAIDGSVLTIQPDGKLIIGDYFSDPPNGIYRYRLRRLETNGSIDPSFNAELEFSSDVRAAVVQPDGKLLVAGILQVNGNVVSIVRFNSNGSPDSTFAAVAGGSIHAIALQPDGKMIVGGWFDALNGIARKNLARLHADGSVDLSYPNGTGGVSGSITYYSAVPVKTIARQANGQIVIGGAFTAVHGTDRQCVARLHADGSLDSAFEPGLSPASLPLSIAVAPDGKVLIGGRRASPSNSNAVIFAPIARVNANGSRDSSFNPGAGPNSDVVAVAMQPDGKVLIAGRFTSVNGPNRDALARLNADGSLDGSFHPPLAALAPFGGVPPGYVASNERAVTALGVQADGKVVVAGYNYTWAENQALEDGFATWRYFIFRFQANGNHDASFAGGVGNQEAGTFFPPTALAIQPDGKIVLAGYRVFSVGGSTRSGILRLNADGTLDAGFLPEPRVNASFIHALALQPDGRMVVAGYLDGPNGYANEVVRFNANGSPDATFVPGTGPLGWVSEVALQPDGKVLIAGEFTAFNGTPRNRIARLSANGNLDLGFNPGAGPDGNIHALALQPDGRVLIGGDFLTVNGVLRPRVARLFGDSVPPPATFATWAASFGLSGALAVADLDPDRDGLASGVEYILGGNPNQSSPTTLHPAASLNGDSMIFTFQRPDASETPDATVTVEAGTDLLTWPAVFTIGATTAGSSPGVSILENGAAPDTITVALSLDDHPRLFARLRVTVTP